MSTKKILLTITISLLIIAIIAATAHFFKESESPAQNIPAQESSQVTVTQTITEHKQAEDEKDNDQEPEEEDVEIDEGELERLMKDISNKTR